jgi:hypothetical protein
LSPKASSHFSFSETIEIVQAAYVAAERDASLFGHGHGVAASKAIVAPSKNATRGAGSSVRSGQVRLHTRRECEMLLIEVTLGSGDRNV